MRHVNTGFYYGPNTLSSVSYDAAIKTTGGERKEKRIKIDSKEVSQGDSEMIVSPFTSLFFSFPLSLYLHIEYFFGKRWSVSTDVLQSFIFAQAKVSEEILRL